MELYVDSNETFFPTSTPDVYASADSMAEETLREIVDRQSAEITNLRQALATSANVRDHWERKHNELQQKIANVKGHIFDMYSMNGEIDEDTKMIADLLDITLTKEIQGTATFEISWTASVPLDFDADDLEISFEVSCDTYEAEDFDYNEDNCDVSGEDV